MTTDFPIGMRVQNADGDRSGTIIEAPPGHGDSEFFAWVHWDHREGDQADYLANPEAFADLRPVDQDFTVPVTLTLRAIDQAEAELLAKHMLGGLMREGGSDGLLRGWKMP